MLLGDPHFLWLLLPLGALVLWRRLRSGRPFVDGGSERVLGALPATLRVRTRWLPGAAGLLAAVLIVGALARPLQGREESAVTTEGIDIVLAVDTSSSMLEQGLERGLTTLDVVKAVVAEFVKGRQDDRLGLISFAAWPRTECPLTLDNDGLLLRLAAVQCVRRNSEEDGTAIGVALGQAARKLKDSDAKSKVIVLLTDGQNNMLTVDPMEATALCKDLGLKVYTIGAGRQFQQTLLGVREMPGDFRLLEEIAAQTGGRFFRARDTEALEAIYAEIDRLERTERQDVRYTDYDDLYPWLLAPAVALLALELLLRRGVHLEFAS
ncbi:MAG TPA: VWA domain-containing protein [Planctomycetota bacterium]|nr:VWA domain-containing protein [Planctomycetota bacterium]